MAEDSTQPPHATRFVETTRGILSYAQLAPLLAERVLRLLQDIEDGSFAARPLDELFLLDLHRNICATSRPIGRDDFALSTSKSANTRRHPRPKFRCSSAITSRI
jgi:hypothetical protein